MNLREALEKETVADVGYRELVSVQVGTPARAALSVMQSQRVGCILVLDGARLRGIVTERDVLMRGICEGVGFDGRVDDLMSPDPAFARVDEPIHRVLARMHAGGFRHLPVLDQKDRPVGSISIKRAVHFLADLMPRAVYNLPPRPGGFPTEREGG